MPTIESTKATSPPAWAVYERQLIDALDQVAPIFIDKYTRPGGALVWMDRYPGDGVWVDDLYEAFFNWPLMYSLGGGEYIGTKAVEQWNAVTRQVTYDYGRVAKEFICNDDWFHNSENYVSFYAIGLSDPTNAEMMRRARRFAGMYMAEDPDVPNYDPEHRIIRSPFSGSKGPLFHARWDDVQYNLEYAHVTLTPTFQTPREWIENKATPEERETHESVSGGGKRWFEDPEMRERVHAQFDKIVMEGDVPVNLGVTGLVAHAYLLTGEDKYRNWIVDYVEAWMDRIRENDGIIPDNVGLNGRIGENREGQWWGGFYGWAAAASVQMMGSAMSVASECAHLVTGDARYLDLLRSQLDMLLDRGIERDGRVLIPHRHKDEGWTDFGGMGHQHPIHLWFASQEDRDWQRLEAVRRGAEDEWQTVRSNDPRSADERPWVRYLAGDCPEYPEAILQGNYQEMRRRMGLIESDDADLTNVDEHHWLQRNPVVTEALQLLTTGGPQTTYWGGLSRGRVRHFDPERRRPGLPPDVAALVSGIRPDAVDLTLVNVSPHATRPIVVQAGAFGEHRFGKAEIVGHENAPIDVSGKHLDICLRPGTEITLTLEMQLHCNKPSYAHPWHGDSIPFR